MTVSELINELQCFDKDMQVRIGMIQRYGSNFAMNIGRIEEYEINRFHGGEYEAVVIMEGGQIGTISDD